MHGRIKSGQPRDVILKDAQRALQVCEYDLPVHYFKSYLDSVNAGKKTCIDFMTEFKIQIGAMTMRMPTFKDFEPVNTKERIKEALAERVRKECPSIARVVLR